MTQNAEASLSSNQSWRLLTAHFQGWNFCDVKWNA